MKPIQSPALQAVLSDLEQCQSTNPNQQKFLTQFRAWYKSATWTYGNETAPRHTDVAAKVAEFFQKHLKD